jgi:Asp-tRNA(Asn)/Glu-tRNA(Gln) amidotransferase A subunit family amidase
MTERGFFHISIGKILSDYQSGRLTPADVAEFCIRQYEDTEPRYHAWEVFDPDRLRACARDAGRRIEQGEPCRPLEGIPVGVKDIFNTADLPTQMGSPIWEGFTPGNDARAVFYLRMAGALVPGKTVTAEFAVHTWRKTFNPHDPTRTPGTSSSGSAVAVATGVVPAAIGTQTAGSIVRPASFCGIYGCKPSFGLIPRTGMLKTTDSLDTIGYFCLHYEDLERLLDVLRVHGTNYPISNAALNDRNRQNRPADRPWRVGLVKTHTWGYAPAYAQEALLRWSERLSDLRDIEVEDPNLPRVMKESHIVHSVIYDKTLSYYFKEEFKRDTLVSPIMKGLISHGNAIPIDQYHESLARQETMARSMDRFFRKYDILISLSTAGEAPLKNELVQLEQPDPALMWTMTYLPVISAPVFVSPGGLPFGVQIVARRYNDRLLLRFCDYLRRMDLIPAMSNPVLGTESDVR